MIGQDESAPVARGGRAAAPRWRDARKRREPPGQERRDDEHREVDGRAHEHRPAQAERGEQQEGGGHGARDGARGVGRVEEPDAASDLALALDGVAGEQGKRRSHQRRRNSRIRNEHTR